MLWQAVAVIVELLKFTKNDIKKRTKENTQLRQELNSIKFEEKRLKNDIESKNKKIQEYEDDLANKKRAIED